MHTGYNIAYNENSGWTVLNFSMLLPMQQNVNVLTLFTVHNTGFGQNYQMDLMLLPTRVLIAM